METGPRQPWKVGDDWRHPLPLRSSNCQVCGYRRASGIDHCHTHGRLRGAVCPNCNGYMASVDRVQAGIYLRPSSHVVRWKESAHWMWRRLHEHWLKCPECRQGDSETQEEQAPTSEQIEAWKIAAERRATEFEEETWSKTDGIRNDAQVFAPAWKRFWDERTRCGVYEWGR